MRVKATIAYDGSAFYGFQRQTSTPQTVTGHIEAVLKQLHIDTQVVGSGRTDRGVHATGQVIHFDLPEYWQDLEKLQSIFNRRLEAVRFRSLKRVPDSFHARFDAKKRLYRYLFKTQLPTVFERKYLSYYPSGFDVPKLHEALSLFEGEHDFRYFHKTGSKPHSTVRTLFAARHYTKHHLHVMTFEANGFLRSQVRMMVESSMQYALGTLSKETLMQQLSGECKSITRLAPAAGLYLAKIYY